MLNHYVTPIQYAILFFPVIAFLFTVPFILMEYHKYGSVSFLKSAITYLFIFYFLCAYFLVILPLPKMSEVAALTTPRTQLFPFCFVLDFIKHSSFEITNPNTYLLAIKESYFYVPIFNILLTIPFGMFLRYYFKCSRKKTVVFTFLLSLFFELTQLTGLYFIYPRGYRLFDVDDLILNTLGGWLGFFLLKPFTYIIPDIDTIHVKAKEKGKVISGFRRTVAFGFDFFLFSLIELISILIFGDSMILVISVMILYYFMIPIFLNTSTFGQKFFSIQVLDDQNQRNIIRLFFRKILFLFFYLFLPLCVSNIVSFIPMDSIRKLVGISMFILFVFIYVISIVKYIFTNQEMLYEKISRTRLISTIQ